MNLHDIFHVARYEAKIQSRDWMLRVLAILTLCGITFFQLGLQGNDIIPRWNMIALPSSMPFVNAYMFNIVQSFIAIFMGTSIFYREKHSESLESLYPRPFENNRYIIGKFCGILSIFVLFNIFSIFISISLNLFYSFSPFNLFLYLFYFFTLTLPTVIFILGLGFWLSGISSSRPLAQVLLLGVLTFSLIFAPSFSHGTLDFSGNSLPNLFSAITGHVNLKFYLLQRSIYLLLGMGFLLLSTLSFHRLVNSPSQTPQITKNGIFFLVLGIANIIFLEGLYANDEHVRNEYRNSFTRHWDPVTCRITKHSITLEQKGNKLFMESNLVAYNPNKETLPELILFLNPGLKIKKITQEGHEIGWDRDQQVLRVKKSLVPGDSIILDIDYEGKIDDRFCELGLTEKQRLNTVREDEFFKFGRKGSFTRGNCLLLPPAAAWYPVAIPPENPVTPVLSHLDFTLFKLKVIHPLQQVMIAPGIPQVNKNRDTFYFFPSYPLQGLTLCGGDYASKRIKIKDITFLLYYFKGHDFFTRLYPSAKLKEMQKSLHQEMQDLIFRNFPQIYLRADTLNIKRVLARRPWYEPELRQLTFIETPLAFDSDWQNWKGSNNRLQPGLVLLPEYGVGLNFLYRSPQVRRRNRWDDEFIDNSLVRTLFLQNLSSPYLNIPASNPFFRVIMKPKGRFGENRLKSPSNPYYLYPLFAEPESSVYSFDYPLIDIALKTILREKKELLSGEQSYDKPRTQKFSAVPFSNKRDKSVPRSYLQGYTIEEVIQNRELPEEILRAIFYVKCEELLNRMTTCSRQTVFSFLTDFYSRHRQEVPFEILVKEAREKLNIDMEKIVREWSTYRHDAHFRLKDLSGIRYCTNKRLLFRFKLFNDGESPGIVTIQSGENYDDFKTLSLAPGEAKAIEFIEEYRYNPYSCVINLGNSSHLPDKYTVKTSQEIDLPGPETAFFIHDIDTVEFVRPNDEIIVDNEDPGFRLIEPKLTVLQSLWNNDQLSGNRWNRFINEQSFGDPVRSYHSKQGSNGETKAEWSVNLPEAGKYEVMALVYHNQCYAVWDSLGDYTIPPGRIKESLKFHYTISHGPHETAVEMETINYTPSGSAGSDRIYTDVSSRWKYFYVGWESLGVYEFPEGKATVVLDDRGEPEDTIIADAVKWVKM